ncbi:MAG: right-handed parallel beta-helix repeat-containing protein [Candidatus Bathyarchaeia archaeon]|jgi:nitrous oxidase accessory protein
MNGWNKGCAIIIIAIQLACLAAVLPAATMASSSTLVVPDDFSTLTAAVANASDGDTILVKNGVYYEQTLIIDKPLKIISETSHKAILYFNPTKDIQTEIMGRSASISSVSFKPSIIVEADNVYFSGFTIVNEKIDYHDYPDMEVKNIGHVIVEGNNVQIIDNVLGTGQVPFHLTLNGDNIQTTNNLVTQTIIVVGSHETINHNNVQSINLGSSFNTVAYNSAGSLAVTGNNNTIAGNSFTPDRGGGGIRITGSNYNTFSNNTVISSVTAAIEIAVGPGFGIGCFHNQFIGNVVEGAALWGILLGNGSNNLFYGNLIANNGGLGHDGYGLALGSTISVVNSNQFVGNIFMNNSQNFGTNWEVKGTNFFDNGTTGNYWDDYSVKYPSAVEIGTSGIGNVPYLVYNGTFDNYPLLTKPNMPSIIFPNPWKPPSQIDFQNADITSPPNPSPTVPEFTLLTIFPLLAATLLIAVKFRHRKGAT